MFIDGLRFHVSIEHDPDKGAPWNEDDSHGIVRNLRDAPAVGYKQLAQHWYYDLHASLAKAQSEGWGLSEAKLAELTASLQREPLPVEIAQMAVFEDYQRLLAWCNDGWHWCGVVVILLDAEGNPTNRSEALWGIESDSPEYHQQVAQELAEQMAKDIGPATHLVPVRIRA